MVTEYANAIAQIMSMFWTFFTSWYLPGTHVTPGMLLIMPMFVKLVMKIVHSLLTISPYQAGSKGDNISKNEE